MDQTVISKDYDDLAPLYLQLGNNLVDALGTFLHDRNIPFHTVTQRVKEKKSYIDKVERKGYTDHRNQIEDLCGIRIVCYYPEDLENIGDIISKEFNVIESINKSNLMEPDRFGYRSDHYIVKIKNEWSKAPNYRNLTKLKAEIQVRTILMHAWADIEHKLAYKSKEQVPEQFRRKLYQLSALLEIADAQFQDLKTERAKFRDSLIVKSASNKDIFDNSQELNLDTLIAFLDFHFPNKKRALDSTPRLLDELNYNGFDFNYLESLITEGKKLGSLSDYFPTTTITQEGVLRFILDIYNDEYWQSRNDLDFPSDWSRSVSTVRELLGKSH